MGFLARPRRSGLPEAGELLQVEALDRSGLLVTREGALVRYLEVAAKNPLVMSDAERGVVSHAFGQLAGRLRGGQSLQIYVEASPVQLGALLAQGRRETQRAAAALERAGQPERAQALARLARAHEQSLELHSDDQAAVELRYYLVVPYLPGGPRVELDWRALLPGPRRRLPAAPLERPLTSHRQAARESLQHTDALRSDLEALELATRLLPGPEVAQLLWRRFNPTAADRQAGVPRAGGGRLEVLGELDTGSDARDAARAAHELRRLVAESPFDLSNQRYLRVDRDLEQVLYVASTPDATHFGWLLGAMQVRRPFTLSVHVHALDRLRERQRQKARHRRVFGLNRGAELRGKVADYEMLAQEEELDELLRELSGQERASVYDVSIYQSIRERGPEPDPVQLAEAVDQAGREITQASDARVHRGEFLQERLWQSSLPLGRDEAALTRKYVSRHVGDTLPLVGTSCGSPEGLPFAFTQPGRTVELFNPFDPAHDNFTLLVNATSGAGKTLAVNILISRLLAHGAQGFVLDRAGHYEFLTKLVPGARHIAIGAEGEGAAVNPWDVEDPAEVSREKVAYLVSLHALLVGDERAGEGGFGLDALERNLLDDAVRGVYRRAAAERVVPRESLLRDELRARAEREQSEGAAELAGRLRNLAERLTSFCGEGSYAYLLDQETSVPADAPLVAFDTRTVPDDLAAAVMFVLAEHVTRKIERRYRERLARGGEGTFQGRSFLVIDEAWKLVKQRATGEWVNDLARRARHRGLFLIAISQQLSDFAGEYGKALIRNSTQKLFLRQAADELAYVQDALRLSDEEVRAIARLKTVKRSYSQAFWINGTRGRGTVELRVGPTEYWLATSDPIDDAPKRARALEQAGDPWRALELLAEEPGT